MGVRIKWDKYETALLIDTFWLIERNPKQRRFFIKKLSDELRKKALDEGVSIDDKFRNVNGITMQLSPIGHAFFPERSSLTTSSMFEEMVDMYKNDRPQFNEILLCAKQKVSGEKLGGSSIDPEVTKERIKDVLCNYPDGLKAKRISALLKIDKKCVNSILYKYMNKDFLVDDHYIWKNKIEFINSKTTFKSGQKKTDYSIELSDVYTILEKYFPYGMNCYSPIELMRFGKFYETEWNKAHSYSDDELVDLIKKSGFEFDGKIYIIGIETRSKITETIRGFVRSGVLILYYSEYFNNNEDWLIDGRILSAEMLKEFLKTQFSNIQFKGAYCLLEKKNITEINAITSEILRVWGDDKLRTVEELKSLLPLIPLNKIKYYLSYSPEFIWNSINTYTRKDLFVIDDDTVKQFIHEVEIKCANGGKVLFEELDIDSIIAENYELSETAIFDILVSLLPDMYTCIGRCISQTNTTDVYNAIVEYCKDKSICTYKELQDYMKDISGVVKYPAIIEAANSCMIRVDYDKFVSDESVHFDVERIDTILEEIVKNNAIGMKEISSFSAFPYGGVSWNLFLLESYCRRFSGKFTFKCLTPNSNNAGAIVKKKCHLDYEEIMAESVANSSIELVKADVYDYLISSGFMVRKKYSRIDELIKKAIIIRGGGD